MTLPETTADVLRVYADAVDEDRAGPTGLTIAMRKAAAERDALAARVRELEDALRPFATGGHSFSVWGGGARVTVQVHAREYDAARAALWSSPSREETP